MSALPESVPVSSRVFSVSVTETSAGGRSDKTPRRFHRLQVNGTRALIAANSNVSRPLAAGTGPAARPAPPTPAVI